MILTKPENISFETQNDIIDYVCKGLPPRKQDFRKVVAAYRNPPAVDIVDKDGKPINPNYKDEVYISPHAIPNNQEAKEAVSKTLDRVYVDRCRNRNIALGIAGITGLVALKCIFSGGCGKKDDED